MRFQRPVTIGRQRFPVRQLTQGLLLLKLGHTDEEEDRFLRSLTLNCFEDVSIVCIIFRRSDFDRLPDTHAWTNVHNYPDPTKWLERMLPRLHEVCPHEVSLQIVTWQGNNTSDAVKFNCIHKDWRIIKGGITQFIEGYNGEWLRRCRRKRIKQWDEVRWPAKEQALLNSTFHRFNDFCHDIRYLIWHAAIPGPRIVDLRLCRVKKGTSFPVPDHDPEWDRYRSFSPPPAMLYVCKESNNITRKIYVQAFGHPGGFPETWIDFSRDFVEVRLRTQDKNVPGSRGPLEDTELVRRIVVRITKANVTTVGKMLKYNLRPGLNKAKPPPHYYKAPAVISKFVSQVLTRWKKLDKMVVVIPKHARFNLPWIDIQQLQLILSGDHFPYHIYLRNSWDDRQWLSFCRDQAANKPNIPEILETYGEEMDMKDPECYRISLS